MRYIKHYNESLRYRSSYYLSNSEIDSICDAYHIDNYTINEDGTIDVNGSVYLINQELSKLPLKFNKVGISFYCHANRLTSLEGAPKEVGGNFDCSSNKLINLEGAPERVGGYFDCHNNQLTSLEGGPEIINGSIDCQRNELTSFRGLPEDFVGQLFTDYNPVDYILSKFNGVESYKVAQLLNEYGVISQDGKKIYRDNLEEVFHVLGKEIPIDLKFKNYEIH